MEQTISLNLTRNSVENFNKVFNSLETLDTKNIDILIIVSIKNKLKICLLSLEEKEFTINFTKEEFIVLKILSKQYLDKKNKPKSNHIKDFDKYLDKKNK
ncbi:MULTISPECIES: hypothetical protein [Aliarcobacter]|uniref:hypothetical protein n=1 Tax=Aliarcobacter TaxID=2321111 RepID=UPI0021B50868|nr:MULTISPECIES: hypothetical protein [Aliarcobacter]MCT7497624.1 hypothetical protein [Aliarcobacter cryaerophilus]MCT7524068.1 hypothetical protein [Aliarcobacter cryaerophilus]MDK2080115.1 hypothetical protein [Aliarcobacter butzleri]